jgi:glutamyl-tRNA(Gln) amidotransferase subunit E
MNGLQHIDYEKLGLRCGLEIHYQLDTQKKLFCNCPVGLRNDPPDAEIIRHMRPTLSELGEYDGTALMEFKTRKEVHYQLYYDSVCTYEMDDTPPFLVNREALEIALEIALVLNCQIADEVHVSRKQYLDGSIPTGFQRTIAVGVNGWVPFRGRKVRIVQLCLEEDACREVLDRGHVIVFRTDRLSTPLVEVITAPDMRNPEEAVEVDREIGRILRATGRVRRGIGTVRQDVNVSIRGGTRVEIKGVPRTGMIGTLVHYEAIRQRSLLSLKKLIKTRKIELRTQTADCSDLFQESASESLRNAVRNGGKVAATRIHRFAELLHYRLTPNRRFIDELKGRVRVIACIDDEPIIFCSDDLSFSGPTDGEWRGVRERLDADPEDALIVVGGSAQDVSTALSEIHARVIEADSGVQAETRQVLKGGETDFERILPGPDRMYPDTDSAPIPISVSELRQIEKRLPTTPEEWRKKYEGLLKIQTINQLIDMDRIEDFEEVLGRSGCDPKIVAYTLTSVLPAMARGGYDTKKISNDDMVQLFELHEKGEIIRENLYRALVRISSGMKNDASLLEDLGGSISKSSLRKIVEDAEKIGQKVQDAEKRRNYLIGYIKKKTGTRASGSEIFEALCANAAQRVRGEET